jgi:hypothetical protein
MKRLSLRRLPSISLKDLGIQVFPSIRLKDLAVYEVGAP